MSKVVCPKHYQAHLSNENCPYCEPAIFSKPSSGSENPKLTIRACDLDAAGYYTFPKNTYEGDVYFDVARGPVFIKVPGSLTILGSLISDCSVTVVGGPLCVSDILDCLADFAVDGDSLEVGGRCDISGDLIVSYSVTFGYKATIGGSANIGSDLECRSRFSCQKTLAASSIKVKEDLAVGHSLTSNNVICGKFTSLGITRLTLGTVVNETSP